MDDAQRMGPEMPARRTGRATWGGGSPTDAVIEAHWTSAVSGNWLDAARWSTNPQTPNNGGGNTFNVFLDAVGAPHTVSVTSLVTIDGLAVSSPDATLAISPSGTLSILAGFSNSGNVSINGGTLSINAPSWVNSGLITLNTGTLNLGGSVATADLGTIVRTGGVINLNGTLVNTGQTLTLTPATGNWNLNGGTIDGGTVVQSGGVLRMSEVGSSRLRNVTFHGNIDLASSFGFLTLSGTNSLVGTLSVSNDSLLTMNQSPVIGGGTLDLRGCQVNIAASDTLTLSSGAVVSTGPRVVEPAGPATNRLFGGGLLNQGTISAAGAGNTTQIETSSLTNEGTIEVSSGALLRLAPLSMMNTGLIRVTGGILDLAGSMSMAGLGTVERTGGTIRISGVLNNTGTTTTLDSTTGSWRMHGGQIQGGTLNLTQGSTLLFDPIQNVADGAGTLRGLILNGDLQLPQTTWSGRYPSLGVYDGLTLSGTIRLSGESATINFVNTQTWNGGTILMEGTTGLNRVLSVGSNQVLTIGPGSTVRGGRGALGGGANASLINQGIISANVAGQTLSLSTPQFSNQGTLEVSNGGTLDVFNTWNSTGLIRVNGGTLRMGGNFSIAGSAFERTGGTVKITGALNNAGNTLTLDETTGSWILASDSRILGGTVQATGSNTLMWESNFAGLTGGRLTAVTFNGNLFAPRWSSSPFNCPIVNGGFTLNGTMIVQKLALGTTGDSQLITGGEFHFDSTASDNELIIPHHGTQTLSPTTVVRGGRANIHYPFGVSAPLASAALINQGLISADLSGEDLYIQTGTFTNTGITEAVSGGRLIIHPDTTWSNSGVIRSAPGATVVLGGRTSTSDLGTLQPNGGELRFAGRVSNVGSTLTFNQTTGSPLFGWGGYEAIIKGGTVDLLDNTMISVVGLSRFDGTLVNGDIHVGANARVMMIGGFDHNGVMHLDGGSASASFLDNYFMPRGTIAFEGTTGSERQIFVAGATGTMTIGAPATIRGGYGALFTSSSASIINQGRISADVPGQTIRIFTQRFQNDGVLEAINGGSITLVPPGDSGPLGALLNEGVLRMAAGSSLTIGGEFTQSPAGSMVFELGRDDWGRVTFYDRAAVDGTFRIELAPGFSPAIGRFYQVLGLSSAGIEGVFSSIDLPALGGGLSWNTSDLYHNGRIGVVPAPGVVFLPALAGLAWLRRRERGSGGAP